MLFEKNMRSRFKKTKSPKQICKGKEYAGKKYAGDLVTLPKVLNMSTYWTSYFKKYLSGPISNG